MDPSPGAAPLLSWFDARQRDDIAWRGEQDPYAILVAEVMAQQTRAETVAPYHRRFMARFPNVQTLAEAEEDEVLGYWEGLGYYARARNLRRAARRVVSEYGGRMPSVVSELRTLPGVGPYTAGAVASLAFGLPEPAVDGNARRVLSRLYDLETASPSALERAARTLLDEASGRPGDMNQALNGSREPGLHAAPPPVRRVPALESMCGTATGHHRAAPPEEKAASIPRARRGGGRGQPRRPAARAPAAVRWPAGWSVGFPFRGALRVGFCRSGAQGRPSGRVLASIVGWVRRCECYVMHSATSACGSPCMGLRGDPVRSRGGGYTAGRASRSSAISPSPPISGD